jgi:hypothetical protein
MRESLEARSRTLREFFDLPDTVELLSDNATIPDVDEGIAAHLRRHNIEWHIIPTEQAVPFDGEYVAKMYPHCSRDFARASGHKESRQEALNIGHHRHQGLILGIETTQKPNYSPLGRQYYGSVYGLDPTLDPLIDFIGRAGFVNGMRFAHDFASLRELILLINKDWRDKGVMPQGFRLTVCPPGVFNLIGNVFHPEWSFTDSMELGFYRDEQGNALCYATGCNGPNDFSLVRNIETNSDWTHLGFRAVLVPEWI